MDSRLPTEHPDGIFTIIVGTAGHIDHGKSTLVRALTGIDPDRLPEEKQREMTIDLGFAPFTLQDGRKVGFIDVPGHERFIKNMVAGATSIDVVLLVVAADEGPNVQTREHVTILTLLGMRRGIIVLTKLDAAEPGLLPIVREEVAALVQGTFFAEAPVCEVSALTGAGMAELVRTIEHVVRGTTPRAPLGVFRMPIQRVFRIKGFGTVITGVPVSGCVRRGEEVEILPLGKTSRVRQIHAYKQEVSESRAGHSSALNLPDIPSEAVTRGMVAATPGYFRSGHLVTGRFRYVPDLPRALKNLCPIKFHAGTAEADGRIVLLEQAELLPGAEALVQFRLVDPVVVASGDPFIVRRQTPMMTIGGGRVIDTGGLRLRRNRHEVLERLVALEQAATAPDTAVEFALRDAGPRLLTLADFALAARIPLADAVAALARIEAGGRIVRFGTDRFLHADAFAAARYELTRAIERYHERHPQSVGLDFQGVRNECRLEPELIDRCTQELLNQGDLVAEHGRVRTRAFQPRLSPEDVEAYLSVEGAFREGGLVTPRFEELCAKLPRFRPERLRRMLKLLIEEERVVSIADDVNLHVEAIRAAQVVVIGELSRAGPLSAGSIRTLLGSSRKYVVALLEYFDRLGTTVRQGDLRTLGPAVVARAEDRANAGGASKGTGV